jgi:hypothetical protein
MRWYENLIYGIDKPWQKVTRQSWITPKTKTKLKLYYTMQTIIRYNLWYNDGVNNLNGLYENSI